jgi:hypothetical protein
MGEILKQRVKFFWTTNFRELSLHERSPVVQLLKNTPVCGTIEDGGTRAV